jgi:hypothetical protein
MRAADTAMSESCSSDLGSDSSEHDELRSHTPDTTPPRSPPISTAYVPNFLSRLYSYFSEKFHSGIETSIASSPVPISISPIGTTEAEDAIANF